MKTSLHIAVIGGGASGMMAAIAAARHGARVTLLERQDRVGRKILATGNGRCNFTNIGASAACYHGADPGFTSAVLRQFSPHSAVAFFESLGALAVTEDEGRVYPLTGQASTILDVLRFEAERLGVAVRLRAGVSAIERRGKGFAVRWGGGEERPDRVVVAAGGMAAPQLGGNGSGMELLRSLGHRIAPAFCALTPLKTAGIKPGRFKGVRITARATLVIPSEQPHSEEGEILFTDYGLSGIPILQLSLLANRALLAGREAALCVDLFPAWSAERLSAHVRNRLAARTADSLERSLTGLIHKRLIPAVLREASIGGPDASAGSIGAAETRRLVATLKRWRFAVTGSPGWNEAQLMAGGARVAEFNHATLESLRIRGLFAAGEVLDVAGGCGGFNLHWAWASGYVAGLHAARE